MPPVRRVLLAFEPPDGGVAENVAQLVEGLRDHGWEPELAAPAASTVDARAEALGVPIHRLEWARGYGAPQQDWRAGKQLRAVLKAGAFDVLHCHSAKAGVIGRLVGRTTGIPIVYSPHCFPFIGDFSRKRTVAASAIERALSALADRIICVCDDERQQGLHVGIADRRMRVVHNGSASCPEDVVADLATAALAEGGTLVASIAVLRPQKRVDVLIDAAPAILAASPDARVAVIGDGPLREKLHARAAALRLDEEPRFAFLPFAGAAAQHLSSVGVFVLPSSWEGLAIGLLEALACGTPTVATDVGGTSEAVVPETGMLVPPDQPAALAAAVGELLADPERRSAMAVAARERHDERFTLGRMVAQTAAVYDELVPA
jgi:glycosyltransferase involved in cell wall biosynthesis